MNIMSVQSLSRLVNMVILFLVTTAGYFSLWAGKPEILLQKGKQLYWAGDYKEAEKKIHQALSLDSTLAEAHYFAGYLYCRMHTRNLEIPDLTWEQTSITSHFFEKVVQFEPDYGGEIISLKPREKIMSEWSALALGYLKAGEIARAKAAFAEAKKRGGYEPEKYEFMKNILLSCPQDAVLITGGDIDTFYPLYMQVTEGIRTDVTVLNIYLCQTPWFITMIKQVHPWQKHPLKLPFTIQTPKDIEKLTARFAKPFDFTIPRPGCGETSTIDLSITPVAGKDGTVKVWMNDLVFLHVLKDNPSRPLCISPTVKDRNFNYKIYMEGKMSDPFTHLERRGLVEVFSFCKTDTAVYVNEHVLCRVLTYTEIPNSVAINQNEMIINEIIAAFVHTASLMEKAGEKERARRLLGNLSELVPGIRYLQNEKQRDFLLGIAGKPASK